ncbi:MAG: hypothetical protein NTY48_00885 [Candidatus Diapherotrites archaeon]|nr:hypothetical protein [Candidatus Diapherotrites archaeon]
MVKFDSGGNALWAKNPVSGSVTGSDGAKSVAVDSGENVCVAGRTFADLNFGSNIGIVNRGGVDFFVVKYGLN